MRATKKCRERGYEMLRNGCTVQEVAEETGACISSVRNWAKAVREEVLLVDVAYFKKVETTKIEMVQPGEWECARCGMSVDWDSYDEDDPPNCNYCPNCGAKVVEK